MVYFFNISVKTESNKGKLIKLKVNDKQERYFNL